MNNFLEMYNEIKDIPELENERIFFSRLLNVYLSNSAFITTITPNFIPHKRESLISSIYIIIYNLKDAPPINYQFLSFMKEIVKEYPIIKERYLNAKIVEDKYQMIMNKIKKQLI